jgi:hypothetical protein
MVLEITIRGILMSTWTTRLAPELTRQFGEKEIHNIWFLPQNWPGRGHTVGLLIPECELQHVMFCADREPLICINRPQKNKNVSKWLRRACADAIQLSACLTLACDTAEQAEWAAKRAAKLLPSYERVALERMYHPQDRVRSKLS